jgi:hypothetical protein
MFPLLDTDGPNPAELFQIWLNLPRADKFAEPYFAMLWDETIPRQIVVDAAGRTTEVTIVAGELAGRVPPPPPPRSWGARAESDLAIWHARMEPRATWTLPAAAGGAETGRVLYVFGGGQVAADGEPLAAGTGAVLFGAAAVELVAGEQGADCLVLQGRPIGEPVAQYGPFVMNDRAGIEQAFADYQRTGFGGWPWPVDDPVHGREDRFARRPDGEMERPPQCVRS